MEDDILTAAERDVVRERLRRGGVTAAKFVTPSGRDELVLVLPDLTGLNHDEITREVQAALQRKVFLVSDGPEWKDKTQEL